MGWIGLIGTLLFHIPLGLGIAQSAELLTDLGTVEDTVVVVESNLISDVGPAYLLEIKNPADAGYPFRLVLQTVGAQWKAKWRVLFLNESGDAIFEVDRTDAMTGLFYTPFFFERKLQMVVLRDGVDISAAFGELRVLRRQFQMAIATSAESAGSPILTYMDAAVRDAQREVASSIVRLTFGSGATCTGFVAAKGRLITNAHCLRSSLEFNEAGGQSPGPCKDVAIWFDYHGSPGGMVGRPVSETNCTVAWKHKNLDLAVLAFDDSKVGARRPLEFSAVKSSQQSMLYSVGHPLGMPVTFTRCCGLFNIVAGSSHVDHDCPTFPGNSGSPLLDETGAVAAITYLGDTSEFQITLLQLEDAYRRGILFRSSAVLVAGDSKIADFVNMTLR